MAEKGAERLYRFSAPLLSFCVIKIEICRQKMYNDNIKGKRSKGRMSL